MLYRVYDAYAHKGKSVPGNSRNGWTNHNVEGVRRHHCTDPTRAIPWMTYAARVSRCGHLSVFVRGRDKTVNTFSCCQQVNRYRETCATCRLVNYRPFWTWEKILNKLGLGSSRAQKYTTTKSVPADTLDNPTNANTSASTYTNTLWH